MGEHDDYRRRQALWGVPVGEEPTRDIVDLLIALRGGPTSVELLRTEGVGTSDVLEHRLRCLEALAEAVEAVTRAAHSKLIRSGAGDRAEILEVFASLFGVVHGDGSEREQWRFAAYLEALNHRSDGEVSSAMCRGERVDLRWEIEVDAVQDVAERFGGTWGATSKLLRNVRYDLERMDPAAVDMRMQRLIEGARAVRVPTSSRGRH